jgi:uncharacterized protein (TIGR00369 family)
VPRVTDVAERFPPLSAEKAAQWAAFGQWETVYFPQVVGLQVEEIRTDYCRMRLPYRPELNQPAGVVHGGAIATLIDTVVVPAIGTAYDERPHMLTIAMNVQFLGAVAEQDAVGEGWVEQRGRSIVFCRAEVRAADGRLCANGTLVYKVSPAR